MISLIARWWITPGKEDLVVPALQRLAGAVRSEPGTLLYLVHLPDFGTPAPGSEPMPRPGEVVFLEGYADWAAFQAHLGGPSFTAFKRDYGAMFVQAHGAAGATGPQPFVQVEFLQRVGGFVRAE